MERVFNQDVRNEHGDVKFRAGEKRDWPKATWNDIAKTLDMSLDDFTVGPEKAAELVAAMAAKNMPAKKAGKSGNLRRAR